MSTTLREQSIETIHDQVVSLVAQRWAKAFVCKVTIRVGLDQNPWADLNQQCDIIGWYVHSGGNTMEWMAEVETEESLAEPQTIEKWKKTVKRGVPFYVLVPRGMKDVAAKNAQDASLTLTWIYEYGFVNGVCHVL
ncbi:hypothetical protein [Petrachloros mirabilis]|jgi:hypothetical protein